MPRGTDLALLSEDDLDGIARSINNRPRNPRVHETIRAAVRAPCAHRLSPPGQNSTVTDNTASVSGPGLRVDSRTSWKLTALRVLTTRLCELLVRRLRHGGVTRETNSSEDPANSLPTDQHRASTRTPRMTALRDHLSGSEMHSRGLMSHSSYRTTDSLRCSTFAAPDGNSRRHQPEKAESRYPQSRENPGTAPRSVADDDQFSLNKNEEDKGEGDHL